jgi:hypothetical protein
VDTGEPTKSETGSDPAAGRKNNTSGYIGVTRHRPSGRWAASIGVEGRRRNLGLFDTPQAAHAAYVEAAKARGNEASRRREAVFDAVRRLHREHGPGALSAAALKQAGISGAKLQRIGLGHADLLEAVDLAEDYAEWRAQSFTYAGRSKPRWTWERICEVAQALVAVMGDLPAVNACKQGGYSQLTNAVHRLGRDWSELRADLGLGQEPRTFVSLSGIEWRNRPQAFLANYLFRRSIAHRRRDRSPRRDGATPGLAFGGSRLQFKSAAGDWVDVELWGGLADAFAHGAYGQARLEKQARRVNARPCVRLRFEDCLDDRQLTEILAPFIASPAPPGPTGSTGSTKPPRSKPAA